MTWTSDFRRRLPRFGAVAAALGIAGAVTLGGWGAGSILRVERGGAAAANPAVLFPTRSKSLLGDRDHDSRLGTILPATRLEVLEQSDAFLKVKLRGWRQAVAPQVIYAAAGRRILSAILETDRVEILQIRGRRLEPDTGQTWEEVEVEAWTPKDALLPDEDSLWRHAGKLYVASCSSCHTAYEPSHYLANQWIGGMDSMRHYASLDKEEYLLLLKYLQMHAQDMNSSDQDRERAGR